MSVICIEGGDACGKATQSKILAERLGALLFSFPDYYTQSGKAILSNLKGEWSTRRHSVDVSITKKTRGSEIWKATADDATNALVLQSLMLTNRLERSADLIAARNRGHVVIDRYIPSTMVYGTYDGLDADWLAAVNAQLPVQPDVYILLDAPVDEGLRRRPERRDRYETDRKRMEFVREEYLRLFTRGQEARVSTMSCATLEIVDACHDLGARVTVASWRVVDAVGTIKEVAERVWAAAQDCEGS